MTNGLKLQPRLPSNSLNSAISKAFRGDSSEEITPVMIYSNEAENKEANMISCVDSMGRVVVGGSNNGVLSVWDKHTGTLITHKQLFGIITGLICR